MRTEVYSWRVSQDLKSELEREARRRGISLSALLDVAATEWLAGTPGDPDSDSEQKRIRDKAAKWIGSLASGNPLRSENVRPAVRDRLRRRYGR